MQGCPGSAFLFTVALDPFLCAFEAVLTPNGRGVLRACADDLGVALRSLKYLCLMEPIFSQARLLAGLVLKSPKCVLIPLAPITLAMKNAVKAWLGRHTPTWQAFEIKASGKYLGFYLGPSAGSQIWLTPVAKYMKRVSDIFHSGAPVSISTYTYNTRVLSVIMYVAQLTPLPSDFQQTERAALQRERDIYIYI